MAGKRGPGSYAFPTFSKVVIPTGQGLATPGLYLA